MRLSLNLGLSALMVGAAFFVSVDASAEDKIEVGTVMDNGLKVVGYDDVLKGNMYEAPFEYYEKFTYEWSPEGLLVENDFVVPDDLEAELANYIPRGATTPARYKIVRPGDQSIKTSNITERATNPFQMIALLRKIYTDPDIPGFRRDMYLENNREEKGYQDKRNIKEESIKDGDREIYETNYLTV